MEGLLKKYEFKSHRIFNTDETGISTVQNPTKILAKKGSKQVGFATSWERGKNITVICALSASGIYVPPTFIFARKRLDPNLKKGGPPGSQNECSEKGWVTEELFLKYLKHFQGFVKATLEDPVLLIMDNHCTHTTLSAYEFCKTNGIVLLTIPPHTSHKMQPLDVAFYGPLKSALSVEFNKYMRNHPHEKITPFEIAELVNNAYMRVATPEKAIRGFSSTGIFPYNPEVFCVEDFAPSMLQIDQQASRDELHQQEPLTPTKENDEENDSEERKKLRNQLREKYRFPNFYHCQGHQKLEQRLVEDLRNIIHKSLRRLQIR